MKKELIVSAVLIVTYLLARYIILVNYLAALGALFTTLLIAAMVRLMINTVGIEIDEKTQKSGQGGLTQCGKERE